MYSEVSGLSEVSHRAALSSSCEIVHGGDSTIVLTDDVKVIREIVTYAILEMLTQAPFKTMKRSAELEQWFEERILR